MIPFGNESIVGADIYNFVIDTCSNAVCKIVCCTLTEITLASYPQITS